MKKQKIHFYLKFYSVIFTITVTFSSCSSTTRENNVVVENKSNLYYKYGGTINIENKDDNVEFYSNSIKNKEDVIESNNFRSPNFLPKDQYFNENDISSNLKELKEIDNKKEKSNSTVKETWELVVNEPPKINEELKSNTKINKNALNNKPIKENTEKKSEEKKSNNSDNLNVKDNKNIPNIENSSTSKSQVQYSTSNYRITHPINNISYIWPINGKVIHHMEEQSEDFSEGISIAALANTPVRATADGIVIYINDNDEKFGKVFIIKHANNYSSAYAHNNVILVKKGDKVKRGQIVAKVGKTGEVDQPQLYFSIGHNNQAVDPES
ncbi:murein hydrolase activator EnvC family protein [Lyticum sinuosum]|uniref:M23 family metallopeptidase n=1 Tax=Lyticum sinuosum TaxID=1332059 RepID=A0AAE4VJ50_9RICK|nr:M23 family metallopeptidase [Lyticum sinuosum]MDZ5760975.1 M23 family metallopeptidase [Lyticum sinuosum]